MIEKLGKDTMIDSVITTSAKNVSINIMIPSPHKLDVIVDNSYDDLFRLKSKLLKDPKLIADLEYNFVVIKKDGSLSNNELKQVG